MRLATLFIFVTLQQRPAPALPSWFKQWWPIRSEVGWSLLSSAEFSCVVLSCSECAALRRGFAAFFHTRRRFLFYQVSPDTAGNTCHALTLGGKDAYCAARCAALIQGCGASSHSAKVATGTTSSSPSSAPSASSSSGTILVGNQEYHDHSGVER